MFAGTMGTVFVKLYQMFTKLARGSIRTGVEVAFREKGCEVVETLMW